MDIKNQLVLLYTQKGELVTELEIMQAQLQRVNQQIIQIKNALSQKPIEKPEKTKGKEKN